MFNQNKGLLNLILSTSAFAISSAGSVLLYIIFAIFIYEKSQSALLTSIFVSLQWLPVLLVILCRSDWDHGMHPKKRWYLLEILCALFTLPLLLYVQDFNYIFIIPILLARGVVEQINRINRTVATKVLFPEEKAAYYAAFMQTGYHVGIGLAAVAGIFLKDLINLEMLVLLNISTYIVAALLILLTRCIETAPFPQAYESKSLKSRLNIYKNALYNDARLFYCAILPPTTATFFQGTYSVLQPIFPTQGLGLSSAEVSISYILATVSIVLGSFGFSYFSTKCQLFNKSFNYVITLVSFLSLIAAMCYVFAVSTQVPLFSAIFFMLMVFIFEFIWMNGYAGIVAFSPKEMVGSVFGITFCIGCTVASVIAAVTGFLIDITRDNFVLTVTISMSMYVLVIGLAWVLFNQLKFNIKEEVNYG